MATRTTVALTLSSFVLTALVVFNAFYHKHQFYPSVVYMTKSNVSLAALYVQAFVFVYLVAQMACRLFFGQLRQIESEHLSERAWYAITETCLAFTVFRDDFSPKFVAQFALLLVVKCFHWLAEDRVDFMERSPIITILFHTRLMSVLGVLSAMDSYFVSHAYFTTLLRGASVQIVFGFEYAILMTVILHVATKYVLHSIDSRSVHPWEAKAVYLLYAELMVTFVRVVLYFTFVMVMIRLHTFPLFSIRPVYITLKSFKKALNDVFMSRRAINYLNNLYPNATEQELAQTDNVCIICREEMRSGQAKKLPCNHIFHASCLRSWFQRQQTCPTCRLDIIQATVVTAGLAQPRVVNNAQQPQPNFPGFAPPPQPAAAPMPPGMSPNAFMAHHQIPHMPVNANMFAPFAMPPPLPMPMFAPPFPLPFPAAPDFTAFTDDEVRQMEQDGRRGVEARVQALRNVQTLLDAAVVQLQQYLSIVPVLSIPQMTPTVDNTKPAPENGKIVNFDLGQKNGTSGIGDEEDKAGPSGVNGGPSPKVTSPENPFESLASGSEAEEVRQRRLKHFSQTQLANNDDQLD